MDFKAFIYVFISFSCVFVASSNPDPVCIQKLMPCQPYLKPPASPPAMCCVPLTEMITDDVACLCSIFDNVDLLKKFNITQADALKLPEVCGAHADLSLCKKGTAAPGASSATPSNGTTPSESATSKKNAANTSIHSGAVSLSAIFVASLILAAI